MSIFLIILTICAALATLLCVFYSWRWSAALAWLSMLPMYLIEGHPVAASTLIFWGAACIIILGINTLLPPSIVSSRISVPYMSVGALAGALAGMLMPMQQAGMIIGTIVGMLLGAIAFSRTPAGAAHRLIFPSRQWFNYTCAKGLPIVIAIASVAIAAMALLRIYSPIIQN